jgi:hypothetical protein
MRPGEAGARDMSPARGRSARRNRFARVGRTTLRQCDTAQTTRTLPVTLDSRWGNQYRRRPTKNGRAPLARALSQSNSGDNNMNAMKMLGVILVVGGILALAYGGFTYTKETHETKIGPVVLSVTDKETVNIPIWAGVGAIVLGGVLLVFNKRG